MNNIPHIISKKMEPNLPIEIASKYSSPSQRIRIITEYWVTISAFCPNCGSALERFENNRPVADFYCLRCSEEFELKSKQGVLGTKIVNGAYNTMIERLKSSNNPNFLFLTYNQSNLRIIDFFTIPKYFSCQILLKKENR